MISIHGPPLPTPPESSILVAPRIYSRVFCDPGTLVDTVRFYRTLTSDPLEMDMDIPEAGLHVTVLTAHLLTTVTAQLAARATVAQERFESPPGPGMRLRHPDGSLVEYLEHRPSAYDVDTPGPAFTDLV